MSSQLHLNDDILPAIFLSCILSFLALGIIIAISYLYFASFPKDKLSVKFLVVVCLSLCIAETVADGAWFFSWTVSHSGSSDPISELPVSYPIHMFCAVTVSLCVQLFYAWRVWILSHSKNYYIPFVIISTSLYAWATVLWVISYWSRHPLISDLKGLRPIGYGWLIASCISDLFISGSMVFYMQRKQQESLVSGYRATLSQSVFRIIQYNTLSLISQILILISFTQLDSIGIWCFLISMLTPKIYLFSLLVSLNARKDGTVSAQLQFSLDFATRNSNNSEVTLKESIV